MTKGQVRWGGDEGTRTLNPRLAKAVRYQLRHVPELPAAPYHRQPAAETELSDRSGAAADGRSRPGPAG